MITEELIEEFSETIDKKVAKRALIRAFNTLPNQNEFNKTLLFRFANKFVLQFEKKESKPTLAPSSEVSCVPKEIRLDTFKEVLDEVQTKKRGRKPLNRGKMILGGTKTYSKSFWDSPNAMNEATNDDFYPKAQPKGNYLKTKNFLKNDWKEIEFFKLPDLVSSLEEKYPLKSAYNGFRVQRWGDASYWSKTGKIAIKPLWKKKNRNTYTNIFY